MSNNSDAISQIIFIVTLQIVLLISLTIIAFGVRQLIIRGIRKIRFRQKQKILEQYHMDLLQIPESLHGLIPYAKEFGDVDSQKRKKHQEEVTLDHKRAFARAIRGKEEEILHWLKTTYPGYTKETIAYAFMLKSLKEMNLLIEYQAYSDSGVEVYANGIPTAMTKRIIYYQPRPKNRIEKFVYDLFTAIIATIISPFYYYFIIKIWTVFSPHEKSVTAFGIICTLAGLFSLFTFKLASWVIKRVWKQISYS
jgi:hypothetical protein